MRAIIFIIVIFSSLSLGAQDFTADSIALKDIYKRKLIFAVYGNMGISNITNAGNDSISRQYKPSMGGGIGVEYYPLSWLGVSVGLGIQQRGAIYTTPFIKGNIDSLNNALDHSIHNEVGATDVRTNNRLKLSGFEIPIMLHLRTPNELARNLRFSAALGVIPTNNFRLVYAASDANLVTQDLTSYASSWTINYTISAGPEIGVGKTAICRLHIFGNWGTTNVYQNVSQNPNFKGFTGGNNVYYGFNLSLLFR